MYGLKWDSGIKIRKTSIWLMLLFFIISGCSGNFKQELTRIDVQRLTSEGKNDGEERIIASKEKLQTIEKAFDKIKWSPKTKAEMARKEDLVATFFVQEEKNMPETLYNYRIWFEGKTATIISSNENEGYGRLTDQSLVGVLESGLLKGE